MSEKLVLIDGHSILNRAYYGLPDLTNSEGLHTNAVYGFLNIMFKILEEEKPDYLTVAFDVHHPTFRHEMFDGYKGTRKPMDPELREQVPMIKEMLTAMGIRIVEFPGFEADDVLGTLSVLGEKKGMDVAVVSGDRDLLQLATDHVMIRIPKTKKTGTEIENYNTKDVKERYLVTPKEFIDVKALMGDTSDNIPGVPGIGEKTASALIAEYGSIEEVHAHADVVKPPRAGKNIVEFWEQAVMSKTLATIITDAPVMDAPVSYDFAQAKLSSIQDLYTEDAYLLCKKWEFKNLLPRFTVEAPKANVEEHFTLVTDGKEAGKIWQKAQGREVGFSILEKTPGAEAVEAGGQMSLFAPVEVNAFCGMAIAFGEEDIYFFQTGDNLTSDYLVEETKAHVGGFSALNLKPWITYFPFLQECTDEMRHQFFDGAIAAYLLNPLLAEYPYDGVAKDYLGMLVPSKEDIMGKLSVMDAMQQDATLCMKWMCYQAFVAYKCKAVLMQALEEKGMAKLFAEIEMPLVFVLADMEKEGICMDASALKEYGEGLAVSIAELEKKIYAQAGEEFNINSPKQLGVILFEKLELPGGKKTKTGYSTSADVLEKMAGEFPIVADILEYRQLTKLKSTYADGLLAFVKEDGKIHTTFNQTITATGRLSSTDPNLQNIPIRIELGKLIRKVFHPMDGNVFVDSDYSQIELRVLAHMADDPMLISAFREGKDIHRTTASQVFHVPFDEVSDLQRRNAKAVNFGIVYGISAFGLSQDLDISKKEAQEYIDSYFATYPKIKGFLDKTVADAKESGQIVTMYGRIRPIPELASSNFMQRQFGERIAMNSPIQGTAADIIKIAMIRVHDKLIAEGLKSRLILQVHDELLIETRREEQDTVIALLEKEMQSACDLSVSMEVGTEVGDNWYDAH